MRLRDLGDCCSQAYPIGILARGHDDLVAVSDNVAESDVWLITHPEFRRDPKVRATSDFLKKIASEPDALN